MKNYDLRQLNILLAEHSPLMRGLVRSMLRELKIRRVRDVGSADAAFNHFMQSPTDMLITDWSPNLDGIGLIKEFRTGEHTPNPYIPIIMMTGYTEIQYVTQARDSGINGYLSKPVSAQLIYSRICSVVDDERPFVHCRDFFGPDRRRRRIDYEGHERRGQKNNGSANRRTKDVPFDHSECRQGNPGYEAPEARRHQRQGAENQEKELVMKGFNNLISTDGKDIAIRVILPRNTFELLRDSSLYQSISEISTTAKRGAGERSGQGFSISDVISRLISENLRMLKESHPRPKTEPTPSVDGKSTQTHVRTNVRVSKESMELMRDIILARVVKDVPSPPGADGVKKDVQHYFSEIIAELVEQNRGKFEEQASALLGSKIK